MSAYLGFEPTKDPHYYFVSYNNEDADRVGKIANEMAHTGVNLWYDHGIDYGDDWETVISDKICNAQAVVLFFTQGILQKSNSYVQKEFRLATQFFHKKVYVVLLDEIDNAAVPIDKAAFWMEINQKQCIGGYTYASAAQLAKDITVSLESGGHQTGTKSKSGAKPMAAGTPRKKSRKGRGCLITGVVTLAVLLLASILITAGLAVAVQVIDKWIDSNQPEQDTTPENPEQTEMPEEDTEDLWGDHIYIPSGPGNGEQIELETEYEPTYTVTTEIYCDGESGQLADSITKMDNQVVAVGESVTVTATPKEGYNFVGWYGEGDEGCLSEDASYTFVMQEKNVCLTAHFNYYTVTTSAGNKEGFNESYFGTYTKMDQKKISVGQTVTLTAEPEQGCNFVGWYDCKTDRELTKDPVYEFTMTEENQEIRAVFSCYTVTTFGNNYEGMAGTYTEYDYKGFSIGETVTLTATVQNGYNFVGWFINDVLISKDLTCEYIMKEKDVSIEARYNYFTLTVHGSNMYAGLAGTVTEYEERVTGIGEQVTLEASVNDGYYFEGWYVDSVQISTELSYTYTMKKLQNVWIEARFQRYTVTVGGFNYEGLAGSFTDYEQHAVSPGKTVTLTATVNPGYHFIGWYKNGQPMSEDLIYEFIMPTEDVYLEANYSKNEP